jgi:hypothetical protein
MSSKAPWLVRTFPPIPKPLTRPKTVYEMPNVEYKDSVDFRALDGQSPPSQDLLESIFKNARFDTRFYTEVQSFASPSPAGPASCMISAALEPPAEAAADFDAWYRDEHLAMLARAPGFVRTRRYELVSGTTLEAFKRSVPEVPKYLALHEFAGEGLPWKQLEESTQTEWAKKVMGGLIGEEVGWYTSKRVYAKEEWGSIG